MSYLLSQKSNHKPLCLFSGDTLFIGDVGRIDLYGSGESSKMAHKLYHSLFQKILMIGDDVILYPSHGEGSVCGGSISTKERSTIGAEKLHNPMLQKSEKDFVESKINEHIERPPYFLKMEEYNLKGPPLLKNLIEPIAFSPNDFQKEVYRGAIIIDTRSPKAFAGAHIDGSFNIWLEGLPTYSGWILPYNRPLLLVSENLIHQKIAEKYLRRLGFDSIIGYLDDGIDGWHKDGRDFENIEIISVHELKKRIDNGDELSIIDVRKEREWISGHIRGSRNIFVGYLLNRDDLPISKPIALICNVGNRASLAASLLKMKGMKNISIVSGSMDEWQKKGYPIVRGD
jgi:hydroxyacylglutathione hydrolase